VTFTGLPLKWINLREEPVVYVRGRPYVLREAARPFHNLQVCVRPRALRLRIQRWTSCES
jgi:hypothetical protein